MPEVNYMDFIHKKKWLNTYGNLVCFPSKHANKEDLAIWSSTTEILSMTGEGDDMQEAVSCLFDNVKEKLWRMTIIVENRMA